MPARKAVRSLGSDPASPAGNQRRSDRYFSRAVSKAFDVLEILKGDPGPLGLQELSTRLGLAKTSVFRLLHTLEISGYLVRDAAGRFSLSPDVRRLVPNGLLRGLTQAASPVMRSLNREFRETVSLAALFDNHMEVVEVVESPHVIRMSNTVGRILPPHASSLGKSITAFQPVERQEKLVQSYGIYRYTPNTITDSEKLTAEYRKIRSRGFATDCEESVAGGFCFGVPVLAAGGVALAAMSLSMPVARLPGEKGRPRLVEALKQASRQISAGMEQASVSSSGFAAANGMSRSQR